MYYIAILSKIRDAFMNKQDQDTPSTIPKNQFWKDPKPPYTMIGSGKTTRMFPTGSVDALAVIGSLNKSQLQIFLFFREMINANYQLEKKYPDFSRNLNEVSLVVGDCSYVKSLMQRNNNIMTLVDMKVVKKGKKKSYMVNPFILIPNREFKRHAATWQYYELIDADQGITLDNILVNLELSLDESIKHMELIP